MAKRYFVYIMTNKKRGVLYIGVTSDDERRIFQHKHGMLDGFTKKYKLNKLVYIEEANDVRAALQREKNLKHWLREWKIALIEERNPEWKDLAETLDPWVSDYVRPEDDKIKMVVL